MKISDCDRLQLTAQAICLEEMFCASIPEAAIFYFETRRREKVALTDDLRERVKKTCAEMHDLFFRGHTPIVKPRGECKNCSLADLCLPVLMKHSAPVSVEEYIQGNLNLENAKI